MFWANGLDIQLNCKYVCHLPRKPFSVFHPRVVARLPAPQTSITAKALNIIITTWMAGKQTTECGHYMESFKGQSEKIRK